LARSIAPEGSTTTIGSGNESIVACAVFWARSSRSVPACWNSRIVRAMALNAIASSPSSSRVVAGTTWSRSPCATARAPIVTARIGRRIDRANTSAIAEATAADPSNARIITRFDRDAASRALRSSAFMLA
jgi:hypothetical protein